MECNKETCRKTYSKPYLCSKCENKFCSTSCMIDHFFLSHDESSEPKTIKTRTNSSISSKRNSNSQSPFIKIGVLLSQMKVDPYFDFKNFEKVKIGKKSQLLGTGSLGEVFLVKNKTDGKFFAVKQMDKQRIQNVGVKLELVRKEVSIHCRLMHENIIRLHAFTEDNSSFYLLMEYADGGNLFSKIKKSKKIDERLAFKYFIQTTAAVHFLHENNLMHRDLKPENILVDEKDNIKLCDFGWCTELEIGNRSTFCGTVEYMAPEILSQSPYDHTIDIWSLGVLLYELVHGYSPFKSEVEDEENEFKEICKNIMKYNFKIHRTDLSQNCVDLITKLLIPNTTERLKTKDVFNHPWVLEFQKELQTQPSTGNNSVSSDINNEYKIKEEIKEISHSADKNFKPVIPKPKISNITLEENKEKIKENINMHKMNSIKEAYKETEEILTFNDMKSDSLFDKVLIQVKEKNKDKRKKSRIEDEDEFDIKNIILSEQKKLKNKKQSSSSSKNLDSQVINELNKFDDKLDKHLIEINKKCDVLNNKKDDINKAIEKSSIDNKFGKINRNYEDDINDFDFHLIKAESNIGGLSKKNKNNDSFSQDFKADEYLTSMQSKNNRNEISLKKTGNYNDQLFKGGKIRESAKIYKNIANAPKQMDLNRELDLNFLPKEVLYNEKTYDQSNKNLLSAIEILENAQLDQSDDKKKEPSFWEKFFVNPFKCG